MLERTPLSIVSDECLFVLACFSHGVGCLAAHGLHIGCTEVTVAAHGLHFVGVAAHWLHVCSQMAALIGCIVIHTGRMYAAIWLHACSRSGCIHAAKWLHHAATFSAAFFPQWLHLAALVLSTAENAAKILAVRGRTSR